MIGVFVRDDVSEVVRHFLRDADVRWSECGRFVGDGKIVMGSIVDDALPLCEACLRASAERES